MKEPDWVSKEECFAVHSELIARFGGLQGVRDEGLLDSALARPQQLFHYGKPSLAEMAAAYAAGIVKNHPFLDGNKRTGFVTAALFIETNGMFFDGPEEQAVLQTLALAAGDVGEGKYAAWLEAKSFPQERG